MSSVDYNTTYDAYIKINVGNETPTDYTGTNSNEWLIHFIDNEFKMNSASNDRLFTSKLIVDDLVGAGQTITTNAGVIGKYSNIYLDYYNGILANGDYTNVYVSNSATTDKIFIKAWIQDDNEMYIDFLGNDNTSPYSVLDFENNYDSKFLITSNDSSLNFGLKFLFAYPIYRLINCNAVGLLPVLASAIFAPIIILPGVAANNRQKKKVIMKHKIMSRRTEVIP
jgi:hypothetical protein